jgi:hypothetical protein
MASVVICLCTKDIKKEDISEIVEPDSILDNDFDPDMEIKLTLAFCARTFDFKLKPRQNPKCI